MTSYFYDSYERHKRIADLLGEPGSILDVGGQLDGLTRFLKGGARVVVANVEGAQEKSDVLIKKGKLPYKNRSFESVCSIDVLEHIPNKERKAFIEELLRVAQKSVILSFPIGTTKHCEYENRMALWLEGIGQNVDYLKEHIKYGLPKVNEIKDIVFPNKYKLEYSGNIKVNEVLFKFFLFDPKVRLVRRLIYLSKLVFNCLSNDIFYFLLTKKKYSDSVNRAYLTIYKSK